MNIIISQSTVYELVLFSILAISVLVQLFYYLFFYIRIATSNTKSKENFKYEYTPPPVSVVICARNEELNLENFLPLVLEQEYPNYEVVVVNDCSYDESEEVLKRLSAEYNHLRVTTIKPDEKFSHGKKLALTIGIKAAKNDWVLLTDADCKPLSKKWLKGMAEHFVSPNEIVLGYGGYIAEKGLLNLFIRYDAFFVALQYLSFALAKIPYMGVGRNLAYKRELFFKNKGFALHATLPSGDDDLFVQQVATAKNTAVCFEPATHTASVASKTFKRWLSQKQRHLTTAPRYTFATKVILAIEPISRLLFWGSAVTLLVLNYNLYIILAIIALRILTMQVVLKFTMNRLNERKLFILSLLYDLLAPLGYGLLMLANLLTIKKSKWN